ncbi:caspase family protein [Antarcticimicrobium luteum]|uniref:Caspase family protein n=1 Tax=Antarcticimicrobium luteum TaxID=2547397 RepID=A0A4R5V5J1_9RHOB|nr:caspase family protein [Antarcticimicrobium luteum]TDK46746.1 caspase family protein [Antarcticimicrobium luteum]
MRFLSLIFALLILPSALWAGRVALVIGNAAYSAVAPLDNPRNDAAAVAAALTRQGFTVLRGDDLGRIGMRDTLRKFRDMADRADIALVYYAGHGIEIGGTNYLVPVDARLEDERDAPLEMVDLDLVLRQISGAHVMKMVVLDACRNNPFVVRMQQSGGSRSVSQGLADLRTDQSDTLVAYAAAAGAITPDGTEGGNSPFTAAFLAALDGPPADVRRVLGRVRDRMRQSVPGAAPFVYSSLGGGEYVINPASGGGAPQPAAAAPPAPASGPSLAEDFVRIDRDGTLADWDAFLIRHEGQSDHPLYAFALEKREALRRAAGTAPGGGRAGLAAPEPDPQGAARPIRAPISAPVSAPAPAAPAAPSVVDLARDIQRTLRASGCYRGGVDGILGPNSQRGLDGFAEAAGISLPTVAPDDAAQLLRIRTRLEQHAGTECKQVPVRTTTRQPAAAKPPASAQGRAGTRRTSPSVSGSGAAQSDRGTVGNVTGAQTRKDTTKLAPVVSSDCIGARRKFYDCD